MKTHFVAAMLMSKTETATRVVCLCMRYAFLSLFSSSLQGERDRFVCMCVCL